MEKAVVKCIKNQIGCSTMFTFKNLGMDCN